jgi:hypothetical protein
VHQARCLTVEDRRYPITDGIWPKSLSEAGCEPERRAHPELVLVAGVERDKDGVTQGAASRKDTTQEDFGIRGAGQRCRRSELPVAAPVVQRLDDLRVAAVREHGVAPARLWLPLADLS